jgi:hypothetical protein
VRELVLSAYSPTQAPLLLHELLALVSVLVHFFVLPLLLMLLQLLVLQLALPQQQHRQLLLLLLLPVEGHHTGEGCLLCLLAQPAAAAACTHGTCMTGHMQGRVSTV